MFYVISSRILGYRHLIHLETCLVLPLDLLRGEVLFGRSHLERRDYFPVGSMAGRMIFSAKASPIFQCIQRRVHCQLSLSALE